MILLVVLPLTNMVKLCEEKVTDGVVISCIHEVINPGEMESYLKEDLTRELFYSYF